MFPSQRTPSNRFLTLPPIRQNRAHSLSPPSPTMMPTNNHGDLKSPSPSPSRTVSRPVSRSPSPLAPPSLNNSPGGASISSGEGIVNHTIPSFTLPPPLPSSTPVVVKDRIPAKALIPDFLLERYKIQAKIGQGTHCKVFLLASTTNTTTTTTTTTSSQAPPHLVVCKTQRKPNGSHLTREADALSRLRHPNVIALLEAHLSQGTLLLEYANGSDLSRELQTRSIGSNRFDFNTIGVLIAQLLLAVDYCHTMGIAHGDLKPANIMFTAYGMLKLGDFGFATYTNTMTGQAVSRRRSHCGIMPSEGGESSSSGRFQLVGTPAYGAPELWCNHSDGTPPPLPTPASDMWACGVVLYECATLRKPFAGHDLYSLHRAIEKGVPNTDVTLTSTVTPSAKPFSIDENLDISRACKRLMCVDPRQRAGVEEIMSLPLFQKALGTIRETVTSSSLYDKHRSVLLNHIAKFLQK